MGGKFKVWDVVWDASTAREGVDVSKLPTEFEIGMPRIRPMGFDYALIARKYGCVPKSFKLRLID